MPTFYCKSCNTKFEAEGKLVEWNDPAFGPCSKLIAPCPENGEECNEFSAPKHSKESQPVPSCSMGGGCCGCNFG